MLLVVAVDFLPAPSERGGSLLPTVASVLPVVSSNTLLGMPSTRHKRPLVGLVEESAVPQVVLWGCLRGIAVPEGVTSCNKPKEVFYTPYPQWDVALQ